MLRKTFRVIAAVSALSVALAAQQAFAFGHHHRGWGGSWGSSGGSWGSSGGSWGSSGGSWGSSGGSWGSSGGSWGSSGGSWGSSGGSWGSSGGSWGSSGGSSGGYRVITPDTTTPATPAQPAPPSATPPAPSDTNTTYHPTYGPLRNSAMLSVKVPADAKVFVNDHPTTTTGTDREYISRDLQNGARYNYDVRAEFVRDGRTVSEVKSVRLTAGQSVNIDFTAAEATAKTESTEPLRTTLKVHVPAEAKLFLAGQETKATGEVREFSTTKLNQGSEWTTYAVRAVVERNGRQEIREESIALKAGETREINIDFAAGAGEKVAETASR